MKKLTFTNYSRYVRTNRDYEIFALCVFLDGDTKLINSIDLIEYVLHPTFPNPVREITDQAHCFALQSEAWGTFGIEVRVFFKDGQVQEVEYPLKLKKDDWPKGPKIKTFGSQAEREVYEALFNEKWQWRKTSSVAKYANQTQREANRLLGILAAKGGVRKAYFRSIDNQELWGATSIVGLLPVPRP
jgi:transcription initiation factor IIF auxiliary subunit